MVGQNKFIGFLLINLSIISLLILDSLRAARIEPQNFVYSSQYDKKHDITNPQGMFNNVKVAKTGKLVFIAAGDSGIKVIDPDQDYKMIFEFKSTEYVEGFAITKDANFVFMPYNEKMTIFDFSDRKSFKQIGQDNTPIENIDMLITDNEEIVFILTATGDIRAVNVKDKKNPFHAGTKSWFQTQIYGGLLSTDNKWLFICQDFQGLGIYAIKYNVDGSVTYTLAGYYTDYSSQGVDITTNMKYIVNIDNRMGVLIGDFTILTSATTGSYPVDLDYIGKNWWPTDITLPAPYSLCISDDDKFLFLGVLAQGVFIIDLSDFIKDPVNNLPLLYQQIIIPYHGMSIKLSYDESDLYYANAESFFVFPKITPNLNEQYINIFNNHLSSGFDGSNTFYYWSCEIDDDRSLYWGAFDDDGLWVLDIKDPQNIVQLQKQFRPVDSTGDIDAFIFLQNKITKKKQYIVIPMLDKVNNFILQVFDTMDSGLFSLKKVSGIQHTTTNYIVDFDVNQDESMLVAAMGDAVVFIDVKDPTNVSKLAIWNFDPGMKGDCTGVMITMSDDYLIGASRGFGYFVLDIQDLSKIKMIQYIDSLGAENMVASDISNDYCFLIDGLRGILIVDITKLPEITIISTILLPGWSNDISFLNNEKLMLVSTLQKSMVTLVDISNIKKPFIVTEYLYENQNGMSTCAFADNSYIFINNNIGVRALPTEGDVVMHVEVQEILGFSDELDSFLYQKMDIEDRLKVGQEIQLDIVFLYQPLDLIVDKLMFYQTQTMFNLPDWITFDPDELSINIKVVKESIDPTNQSEPLLNIIIIKTVNPLYVDDFTFTTGPACSKTTSVNAAKILEYILEQGILDDQNIVDPELEYPDEEQIVITGYPYAGNEKCLSDKIKFTLLNSIQYTPIYLFMQSSLIFNNQPTGDQKLIETITRFITVNLKIPKFSGNFIFENQISVDISINEEKNEIDIQGSVENVNDFLDNKIILFPIPPLPFSNITAKLTIEDNANYPYENTLPANQISFIIEKKFIQINSTLSDQLSDDYENGEIEILTDFLFQFDESTFWSPDIPTVKYDAFIEEDGEYVHLDQGQWLQFNPEGQKFFGNPPQSSFRSVIKIKLVGDDGYTKISDTFEIKIYKLPILFVIKWIAQIVGPIVGVIGLYKYRNYQYNSYFKRRNRYSKMIAQVNENFILKIPLISNEVKQAKQMIESLIQKINQTSKSINLSKITRKKNSLKIEEPDKDDFEQEQEEKQNKINQVHPLAPEDIEQNQILKGEKVGEIEMESRQDNRNTEAGTRIQGSNKQVWNTDKNDVSQQFHDKIIKAKPYFPETEVEKKYLTKEGKLNMQSITEDMIKLDVSFKAFGKDINASSYKEELQNKKSALYICIKYLFARYLLSLDLKSFLVFQYIHYYGKKNCFLYTQNDWYKQFVVVYSDDKLDEHGRTIIFPIVKLIIESINTALLHLKLITSRLQSLETLTSQQINPYLIKLVLKAEATGIHLEPASTIFPCVGESIHLKSHELRSVESFKYSPGSTCFSLKKLLNMEYDPYGPKENMQFPNWLQLIMQPGVIILQGTPQIQDMEEVLIRFYGHQGFIYRSFTIRVQDSEGNSSRSQVVSQKSKNKPNKKTQSEYSPILKAGQEYDQNMDEVIDSSNQIGQGHHVQRFSVASKNTEQSQGQSPQLPLINQIQPKESLFRELNLNED